MKIYPKSDICGEFIAPPDKSITHCALALGAIANGKTYIVNPLLCEDTKAMIVNLKKLGVKIKIKSGIIEIKGVKSLKDNQRLDCRNSETCLKLLCGLVVGLGAKSIIYGNKLLNQIPMKGIKEPLEIMGATVALADYKVPPVLVESDGVKDIEYNVDYGDYQTKYSIMLSALSGGVTAKIHENYPSRNHFEILAKELGANLRYDNDISAIVLEKGEIKGKRLYVCGDISVALCYLSLGILLGQVTIKNIGINNTRTVVFDILRRMGAKIEIKNKRLLCGECIADITARKSKLKATHVSTREMLSIVDELPMLCVLMGVSEGESIISGTSKLQYKDADRIKYISSMLTSIGGKCKIYEDGLTIQGVDKYDGGFVETHGDARIAMSASIALSASIYGGDTDCDNIVYESYPDYWKTLFKNIYTNFGCDLLPQATDVPLSFLFSEFGARNYLCCNTELGNTSVKRAFNTLNDYSGYNIYSPYSKEALKRITNLFGIARNAKSIDTVKDGVGYSVCGYALLYALKDSGLNVSGKQVLILGAGSTGRSVAVTLSNVRAKIDIYDIDVQKAVEFVKGIKGNVKALRSIDLHKKYYLIVNATTIGYGRYDNFSPISRDILKNVYSAVDYLCCDKDTKFITMAKEENVKIIDSMNLSFMKIYLSACIFADKNPIFSEAVKLKDKYKTYKGDIQ